MNESLTRFFHTFNSISNSHALIASINIKNKSDKPWVTTGLRKSIKIRNDLYIKWLTTRIIYHKQYDKVCPTFVFPGSEVQCRLSGGGQFCSAD